MNFTYFLHRKNRTRFISDRHYSCLSKLYSITNRMNPKPDKNLSKKHAKTKKNKASKEAINSRKPHKMIISL